MMERLVSIPLIWAETLDYFSNRELWINWSIAAVKIILIFTIARFIIRVLNRTMTHIAEEKNKLKFNPRRTTTIVRLMGNILRYAINFIMILMILGELGIPLGPMLAGAGVLGLAIGFGAQSLVKDIITGFFIIFEDQFAVGDIIQTKGYKGAVEEIGLRTTRIKSWTGEVHIIPNGAILEVTNFSVHHSLAVLDITITNEPDSDQAIKLIQETIEQLGGVTDDIVKKPEVLGVQAIASGHYVLRVTCACRPNTQNGVARLLNAAIKKSLDAGGIQTPSPRVVTYHRNDKAE